MVIVKNVINLVKNVMVILINVQVAMMDILLTKLVLDVKILNHVHLEDIEDMLEHVKLFVLHKTII